MKRQRRKWILAVTLIATAAGAIAAWLRHISAAGYRGPVSDHFDGERFHNLEPTPDKSIGDLLKWNAGEKPQKIWAWRGVQPARPTRRVEDLRLTMINHATLLIQVSGLNILTDPIWSERTSPLSWAGPRRHHNPGIRFEDLPPIDVVLVSHNHWDHLDLPTLRRLSSEHRPRIIAPLGNREYLHRHGIRGTEEVDWWQTIDLPEGAQVVSVPVQHWSTRTRIDLRKTLWSGYVIKTDRGNVYFAGDTGLGSGKVFSLAQQRHGPFRLALLPIGAYLPRWFMKDSHLSPADAIEAHRLLGASTSIAIHYGCFDLGNDSQDQAPTILRDELQKPAWKNVDFRILAPGQSLDIAGPGVASHESGVPIV